MPDPMIVDCRDQTAGVGPARAGIMRGGLIFEQLGTDILLGGIDPSQDLGMAPSQSMRRFMGQIWVATLASSTSAAARPYDEGGTNDWHVTPADPTAKGAVGLAVTAQSAVAPTLHEVLTADRPYLVLTYATSGGGHMKSFASYNPDTNAWAAFAGSGASTYSSISNSPNTIVHDGLLFCVQNDGPLNAIAICSFDPVSGGITAYALPIFTAPVSSNTSHRGTFFTLHDRLFMVMQNSTAGAGENVFTSRVFEFAFGIWSEAGSPVLDLNFGDQSLGGRLAVFKISPTKVLVIGCGSEQPPNGGVIANVLSTVGNSKSGALENVPGTLATSIAVVPLPLRPKSAGYGSGGGLAFNSVRCYGYTFTDDPTGTTRHFMFYHPDGAVGPAAITTVFEVFDENTQMVALPQAPQSDSDMSFSEQFYGGGAQNGGVDGTTRYVSVQARGWATGNAGVRINVSAHGDPVVLAYRGIAGGPFTAGELITGGTSAATGILVGDGAAEGLYLRAVVGIFVQDEVVTGGTSGATATLNGVLVHGATVGAALQVGEVVTGGTSGATATVSHVGLDGPGEQLVKVGAVTTGPFINGETITGSASLGVATLSSAPLGAHGGAADKTIRARFYNNATGGKGPPTGFATMVLGSGVGGLVSKGTGPSASDELINVVADGAPGDIVVSFEWDFLTDGVPAVLVSQMTFEIDRT